MEVLLVSGESDEDFSETVNLVKEYKFSQVHISQFYPRPGILLSDSLGSLNFYQFCV